MEYLRKILIFFVNINLLVTLVACSEEINENLIQQESIANDSLFETQDNFSLIGDYSIDLTIGDNFFDPGINIQGKVENYSISKTTNINLDEVGIYYINYEIKDLSGTVVETINRTISISSNDINEFKRASYIKITFSSENLHREIFINSIHQVVCKPKLDLIPIECDESFNFISLDKAIEKILDSFETNNLIIGIEYFNETDKGNLYQQISNQLSSSNDIDYFFIDIINPYYYSYSEEHTIEANLTPYAYKLFFDEVRSYSKLDFEEFNDVMNYRIQNQLDNRLSDFIAPSFSVRNLRFEINSQTQWDWSLNVLDLRDNIFDVNELTVNYNDDVIFNKIGDYFVNVTVSDPAGNIETKQIKVTIEDTIPPVIELTYYHAFSERAISASDKFVNSKIGNDNAVFDNFLVVSNSERNRVYVYKVNEPNYERIIKLENNDQVKRDRESGFGHRVFLNNSQIIIFDRYSTSLTDKTIGSVHIYDLMDESYSYTIENKQINTTFQSISVKSGTLVIESSNNGFYIYDLKDLNMTDYFQPSYMGNSNLSNSIRFVFDGKYIASILTNSTGCSAIAPNNDEVAIVYNIQSKKIVYEEENFNRYCGGFWYLNLYDGHLIISKYFMENLTSDNPGYITTEFINLDNSDEISLHMRDLISESIYSSQLRLIENSRYIVSYESVYDSTSLSKVIDLEIQGVKSLNDKFLLISNSQLQDFYYFAGKSVLVNFSNGYQTRIIDQSPTEIILTRDGKSIAFPNDGFIVGIGSYEMIVTDKAGNNSTVEFIINE